MTRLEQNKIEQNIKNRTEQSGKKCIELKERNISN